MAAHGDFRTAVFLSPQQYNILDSLIKNDYFRLAQLLGRMSDEGEVGRGDEKQQVDDPGEGGSGLQP